MTGIGLECIGFGRKSIKHYTVFIIMLDFDTFCNIFYFFVRSNMATNYFYTLDNALDCYNSAALRLV